jgi:hypothetical protein
MADPRDPAQPSLAPHARYAQRAARVLGDQLNWSAVSLGAVLCFLGWYGVSGERYPAQQVPYLASATVPGAALLLGGFVLVAARHRATRPVSGQIQDAEQQRMFRQLELLYQLLTDEVAASADPAARQPSPEAGPFAIPGGRSYHRADCLLVQGRDDLEQAVPATQPALQPCPLCEPPEPPEPIDPPDPPDPPDPLDPSGS